MDTVSCIIPTYKKFEYLKETLDSIFNQDYAKIEIVISDDGSGNFEVEAVRKYIEKNKTENIVNYIIIAHEQNVGTVKNMNLAIDACAGKYIIPIACDDKLYNKNVISLIVERFKQQNCDILVCSRMKCTKNLKEEVRLMPHPGYIKYIYKKMNTASNQFRNVALGNTMEFASGAAMYYTKKFFNDIGGYDERYFLWEDGPFIAKVTRLNNKIELAYDIVSIFYRDGGISSKAPKNSHLTKIEKDYVAEIDNEFLDYDHLFNKFEKRIILGRKELLKNKNKITFKIAIKYPETVINISKIKFYKFIYRYIVK